MADASSRNAVARFETNIQKKDPKMLDDFDEDAFRAEGQNEGRESVQELFGFIDDVYVSTSLPLSSFSFSCSLETSS